MNPAILLVDFDSPNRDELQAFLQSQQCDVEEAADGESAVRCCLQMQPDLVLLYDGLPDIGSFELCRRLKKDLLNQLTSVVLVKPSPDQWDIHRGREAGAMDIWPTPPSLWDLLERIQTLLRLKKYMDEQAKSVVFSVALSVDSKHAEWPLGSSRGIRGTIGRKPRLRRRRPEGPPPRVLASRYWED